MKTFPEILKEKRDYYGYTEAAIEFAAEEWWKQSFPTDDEFEKFYDYMKDSDSWGMVERIASKETIKWLKGRI